MDYSTQIVDVSSNNGVVDWKALAATGLKQVMIRLSLGYNSFDHNAINNAKGAAAAGLSVGYYHFAYPDKTASRTLQVDAKEESNYFTGLISAQNLPKPNLLAIDLEPDKGYLGWGNGQGDTNLNPEEYQSWLTIFLNEATKAFNIPCMIYSYKDYLDTHLPSDHPFGDVPLWLANYGNLSTPPLPHGWTAYKLWQYNSTATISGINGHVDMSRAMA